jgi:glycosyltransferase involved in cell wall biosynthesis
VSLLDAHFGYPEGVGCMLAARKLQLPVFITMRGLETQILTYRDRGPQLLWALRQCTGIVCVSESLRSLALSQGISAQKIRVIPNAVNREIFRIGSRDTARRQLAIAADVPLIVSVGMLVHGKGQHLLLQAHASLRQRMPEVKLVLIGGRAHEPRYPGRLRTIVSELQLDGSAVLTGPLPPEQVAKWLQAADIFALPTFDEGCCNAILEAMACGLPVVTTPVGDNPKLVSVPERGILVPMNDVEGLLQGLEAALHRTWDRSLIAEYGADHSWEQAARQTGQFFRERLAMRSIEALQIR